MHRAKMIHLHLLVFRIIQKAVNSQTLLLRKMIMKMARMLKGTSQKIIRMAKILKMATPITLEIRKTMKRKMEARNMSFLRMSIMN